MSVATLPVPIPDGVHLVVAGVPEPKGSMTPITRNGRTVLIPVLNRKRKDGTRSDGRQRYERWCRQVTAAAFAWRAIHGTPFKPNDALEADIVFYLPRPKSTPKSVEYPATKPDLDKLVRAVFDCLKRGELIFEDSRFVTIRPDKVFADERGPRAEITVRVKRRANPSLPGKEASCTSNV